MSQSVTRIPLFFWTGYNWGRLFLCFAAQNHRTRRLGTGCNAKHGTRGPGPYDRHGLMGTLYFSSCTITCLSRASRPHSLSSEILASCNPLLPAPPKTHMLPCTRLFPGAWCCRPCPSLAWGRHQRADSSVRASLHRSLPNISFFSPHNQYSPLVVVYCLHTLREAFAGGESA